MIASLVCPRCKTENAAEQQFCQKCGLGLVQTGRLSPDPRSRPTPPPGAGRIGETIAAKYKVVSVLGEGGFGTVYKVEQVLLGENRTFALKLLHPELSEDEHFRARFTREAGIAMELVHPNAVPVRDFGLTEDGQLYFSMDYCRGESLKETLAREGYLTVNRAIEIVREILKVLEVAHEKQIIHRDLKPENIFIERDSTGQERVKVGDFGLARSVRAGQDLSGITKGAIVGTPRYMSPEQGRGEPLDARSDLYSLGVIFFEMLAGDLPPRLDKKNGPSRLVGLEDPHIDRLRERIPANLVIPRGVLEVVGRALEPKPANRYQSATEFRETIERLPTYTPTYIEPRRNGRTRGRSLFRRVAVVALVIVALTGIGWGVSTGFDLRSLIASWQGDPSQSAGAEGGEGTAEAPVVWEGLRSWIPYAGGERLSFLVRTSSDGKLEVTTESLTLGPPEENGLPVRFLDTSPEPPPTWWKIDDGSFARVWRIDDDGAPSSHRLLVWQGDAPAARWGEGQWVYRTAEKPQDLELNGRRYECLVITAEHASGTGARRTTHYARGLGEILAESYRDEQLVWRRERVFPLDGNGPR